MTHLLSSEARVFRMHGVTFRSFTSSATGARSIAAWQADFAPTTPGEPHTMTEEEVFHVLAGALDFEIDAERFTARTGDAALVPAGARLAVSNHSHEPARAWVGRDA